MIQAGCNPGKIRLSRRTTERTTLRAHDSRSVFSPRQEKSKFVLGVSQNSRNFFVCSATGRAVANSSPMDDSHMHTFFRNLDISECQDTDRVTIKVPEQR
jgi:hypothetical protein